MQMTDTNAPRQQRWWRSRWVLAWIAIVLVVLFANATMIYLAMDTSPGLVAEDYYERGREFERTVLARRARSAGLSLRVQVPSRTVVHEPATYGFVAADSGGTPLEADEVVLFAYRPSDAGADFSVPMAMEAKGRYRAEVVFPLKGVWDIVVSVRRGEDEQNVPQRVTVVEP